MDESVLEQIAIFIKFLIKLWNTEGFTQSTIQNFELYENFTKENWSSNNLTVDFYFDEYFDVILLRNLFNELLKTTFLRKNNLKFSGFDRKKTRLLPNDSNFLLN